MKERLILGAIVLLLATWFALDAIATIILPLRFAALPLPSSSIRGHASAVHYPIRKVRQPLLSNHVHYCCAACWPS